MHLDGECNDVIKIYNKLYYNSSATPTLQPDDVIVSSSPANACVANADDEEQCHRPRKKRFETIEAPAIEV